MRMVDDGLLTGQEIQLQKKQKRLPINRMPTGFQDELRMLDRMKLNASQDIRTTVDRELSYQLFDLIQKFKIRNKDLQVAGLVADPVAGEILAIQGSKKPNRSAFNRALYTKRPMGPLMIPLVLAVALENGYQLDYKLGQSGKNAYQAFASSNPFLAESLSGSYWFGNL